MILSVYLLIGLFSTISFTPSLIDYLREQDDFSIKKLFIHCFLGVILWPIYTVATILDIIVFFLSEYNE